MALASKRQKTKAFNLFDSGLTAYGVHQIGSVQAAYSTLYRWFREWEESGGGKEVQDAAKSSVQRMEGEK